MNITQLRASLTIPVIAAPMYLVSGPDLVIEACKAGVIGSFNSLNAVTTDECAGWLTRIETALQAARDARGAANKIAPYALNIIVRPSERFAADLALAEKFRVPVVITGVGSPVEVTQRVQAYGGTVFHDVATIRHAEKAVAAGVDGLVLLTAGAGGHTGHANPFSFVRQVRRFWDGTIILAGGISDGYGVRAAEVLGADLVYMGTRFAATEESLASSAYKQLLVDQAMADILVTDRISGLPATFMRGSIKTAGLDPENLPPCKSPFKPDIPDNLKAWRDIWSAGHGVGSIIDVPSTAVLVDRLLADYESAAARRS
jgi:nitronate monooxygenase